MRLRIRAAIAALIGSSFSTAGLAQQLQPAEKWAIDYGDTQCTAARTFGNTADPTILGIVPALNGQSYQIIVSRERAGPIFAREYRGTVDFGQGGISTVLLFYGAKGVNRSNYQYRLSAADVERARNASAVTFASTDGQKLAFALSDMGAVLDGLKKCNGDLQGYWNLGRAAAVPANAPAGNLERMFRPEDYPPQGQLRHGRGASQFQLLVDEKGAVERCDVVTLTNPAFELSGCGVFTGRARFKPAVDAQGKAIRSVVTTPTISWQISSENALDSGCTKVSSDGRNIVSMCNDQMNPTRMIPGPVLSNSAPPPPSK